MFDIALDTGFDHELDDNTDRGATVATYALLDCPPLARGLSVALVGAGESGENVELARFTMKSREPIENLARMRYAAVHAGASEIVVWR